MEDATLLDYLAAVPKVSKKSVDYSNETLFAKAAKVEKEDNKVNTSQEIPDFPQDDNHSSGIFVTVLSSTVPIQEVMAPPPHQALPGAFPVQGQGTSPQNYSFVNGNVDFDTNEIRSEHGQLEPATPFNAELVVNPELASASLVDIEAEEKAQCRRQVRTALVLFLVIGILVSVIAIPIQLLKPEPSFNTPHPSETPSASPSENWVGFIVENSFDNGAALSTPGTSQEKALTWVMQNAVYNNATNYIWLQLYVLAVYNYATDDLLSCLSWLRKSGTPSQYQFCDWRFISCNNQSDITVLGTVNLELDGSLPPEIGLLKNLTFLDLSSNKFNGTLPTEIGLLTSLSHLDLSSNTFNDTLPTEIGLLTSLTHLDLSSNTFNGTLPTEIGLLTSLTLLDLFANTVNGTNWVDFIVKKSFDNGTAISTPGTSQAKALKWMLQNAEYNFAKNYILQLYGLAVLNYATGDLLSNTSWLKKSGISSQYNFCDWDYISCNGGKDITDLTPSQSQLVGSLPPEIGLLTSLTLLDLSNNTFTGTLPTEIGLLSSLGKLTYLARDKNKSLKIAH